MIHTEFLWAAVVGLILFIYLIYTILKPEEF